MHVGACAEDMRQEWRNCIGSQLTEGKVHEHDSDATSGWLRMRTMLAKSLLSRATLVVLTKYKAFFLPFVAGSFGACMDGSTLLEGRLSLK